MHRSFQDGNGGDLIVDWPAQVRAWLSPRSRRSRIAATRSAGPSCRPAWREPSGDHRSMPRSGHAEGSRLRDCGAQRRQWPRQRRGPGAQGSVGRTGRRSGRSGGLCRAAAHHRRYHGHSRQREAGPARIATIRAAADAHRPQRSRARQAGAILLRPRTGPFVSWPVERLHRRRQQGAGNCARRGGTQSARSVDAVRRAAIFRGRRSQACAGDFRAAGPRNGWARRQGLSVRLQPADRVDLSADGRCRAGRSLFAPEHGA